MNARSLVSWMSSMVRWTTHVYVLGERLATTEGCWVRTWHSLGHKASRPAVRCRASSVGALHWNIKNLGIGFQPGGGPLIVWRHDVAKKKIMLYVVMYACTSMCWHMVAYAGICWHMLAHASIYWHRLPYVLAYASVWHHMLA